MKKIIALTCSDDFHTKSVNEELNVLGERLVILEREKYGIDWVITAIQSKSRTEIELETIDGCYSLNEIGSIWNRREFVVHQAEGVGDAETVYIGTQTAIHVNGLFRFLSNTIPTMNTPMSNWRASSKFMQSSIAKKHGFLIPETYQGGSHLLADKFCQETTHGSQLCIKPLESIHLKSSEDKVYAHFNSIFKRRSLDQLVSLRNCPVILQSFIDKDYEIRVTVVGDDVFAASIDTKNASSEAQIDWRHYDWANTPYYKIELPIDIQKGLKNIMQDLDLSYGAFDLIKSTSGGYYFLEVNSQGQWLWTEDLTGLKISNAVANWLLNKAL